jgi:hypothetical protein
MERNVRAPFEWLQLLKKGGKLVSDMEEEENYSGQSHFLGVAGISIEYE